MNPVSDLRQQANEQLSSGIARQRDELLLGMIRERIGDFEIESLRGRLTCTTFANDPERGEDWVLDGKLLAVFYPVEFTMEGMTMKVTQRYRAAPTP